MKTLFNDEKIVLEFNSKVLTLTNKRIWKVNSDTGKTACQSIMLNHISSIQCTIEDYIIYLILAAITFLVALFLAYTKYEEGAGIAIVFTILFIVLYFATKVSSIIIASSSAKIKLAIKGMKKDQILDLIDKVESAINDNALK